MKQVIHQLFLLTNVPRELILGTIQSSWWTQLHAKYLRLVIVFQAILSKIVLVTYWYSGSEVLLLNYTSFTQQKNDCTTFCPRRVIPFTLNPNCLFLKCLVPSLIHPIILLLQNILQVASEINFKLAYTWVMQFCWIINKINP